MARPVCPGCCPISANMTVLPRQITPKALCSTAQGCEAAQGPWSDQGFNPERVASWKGLRPAASVEGNPFEVEKKMHRLPRVAAGRQPRAALPNTFGVGTRLRSQRILALIGRTPPTPWADSGGTWRRAHAGGLGAFRSRGSKPPGGDGWLSRYVSDFALPHISAFRCTFLLTNDPRGW